MLNPPTEYPNRVWYGCDDWIRYFCSFRRRHMAILEIRRGQEVDHLYPYNATDTTTETVLVLMVCVFAACDELGTAEIAPMDGRRFPNIRPRFDFPVMFDERCDVSLSPISPLAAVPVCAPSMFLYCNYNSDGSASRKWQFAIVLP